MRTYLQSLGYTILRWAEWCEDHMEFTVIAPTGEVLTAEAEWMLVPGLTTVGGPRSTVGLPVWYMPQAA